MSNYFTRLAEAEGLPAGRPQGFDAAYLHHQLPGGTVGTMRRHLAESRLSHLEGAVIEELDRVRAGTRLADRDDAVRADGDRAGRDERDRPRALRHRSPMKSSATRSAASAGPMCPSTPEVMERIESLPRTRELRAEPPMAELSELRRRVGCRTQRRGFPAARDDARRPGRRHAGGRPRRRATTIRRRGRCSSCCTGCSRAATSTRSRWRSPASGWRCGAMEPGRAHESGK